MSEQTSNSATLLKEILDITRGMRRNALDSDWETVREEEQRRQQLIKWCFPFDRSIADPDQAADSITEIIELDRSMMLLLTVAREDLGNNMNKLELSRQVASAYAVVETGS